jgi:hypothetical protein
VKAAIILGVAIAVAVAALWLAPRIGRGWN